MRMLAVFQRIMMTSVMAVALAWFVLPDAQHYPASQPEDWAYDFPVTHRFFDVNNVRLHALDTGDMKNDKETFLFLHGFPESSDIWKKQLQFLSSRGYRCVAIDMRGFYVSEKPVGAANYTMPLLVEDVRQVITQLQAEKLVLVGHDWGAGVAWALSMAHPEILHKMAIFNVPHPQVFTQLVKTWDQFVRSWYIWLFQLPYIPEEFMRRRYGDFIQFYRDTFKDTAPGLVTDEDIRRHAVALGKPGAVTGGINYYRAAVRTGLWDLFKTPSKDMTVRVPTLILWGMNDVFIRPESADMSAALCENVRLVKVPNCTHWIVSEKPELINNELVAFVSN